MPTYQTLLPVNIYPFLDSMAALYSQIERDMNACLMRGEKINVIEKSLQSKYKVDSTTARNVYHNLKGKHSSIKELRKTQAKELKGTIRSIKAAIKKRQKKKQLTQKDRFFIHQKKRRLSIKLQKLEKLTESRISLCFGTKKLFLAQYHLEENGYSSHEEWLTDWKRARVSNFMMVGSKTYAHGNQLCRLTSDGQLIITTPPCLLKQFDPHIKCDGIKFKYGQTFIDIALTPTRHKRGKEYRNGTEKAVTHRFVKRDNKWYLHTTVELPDIPWISHRKNGAIGIDLNAKSIAWTYCDNEGNLKQHGQVKIDERPCARSTRKGTREFDLENKSSGQTTHILSLAIGKIIDIAVEKECPIVIEKLDFSSKKTRLREHGKRYAKMLSQFAYSKFSDLVHSKARLSAIQVVEVNPAYSSLIGMIKFMSLYGLNSGTSAALVLARRLFRFSERLPRCLNALLEPVDSNKHVWHYWAATSKLLKGCHRHSFFNVGIRFGDKPNIQSSSKKRKILGKCKHTPIIPSYPLCLG